MTSAFVNKSLLAQNFNFVFTINGLAVTNTAQITTKSINKLGSSVNTGNSDPTSASPVLQTNIDFTLSSDFPMTLTADNVEVWIKSKTNATAPIKFLRVVSVDDATKTITTKFGGAHSDTYDINIRHNQYGLVDMSAHTLTVGSSVTSMSPAVGSVYGGTLLTINGNNFGTVKTDNPVTINYNGALGAVPCYVKETSETQIKCRVGDLSEAKKKPANQVWKAIVFLKTSEEATCTAPICKFTFTDSLPTITALAPEWDATALVWKARVTGTGFTGAASANSLEINGREQTTHSVNPTDAYFTISDVDDLVSSGLRVYFEKGNGLGSTVLDAGLTLTPKLTEITPNTGSAGGSVIAATVHGLGTKTQGVNLVDAAGAPICDKVTITKYSRVECHTKAAVMASAMLKVRVGANDFACANTNTAKCNYEQTTTGFPDVSAVAKSDSSTIAFTGTGFFTAGYDAKASFGGHEATAVVVASATSATATFAKGIPTVSAAEAPKLWFVKTTRRRALAAVADTKETHYASNTQTLDNALAVTTSSTGLSCSFAGGCLFEITASGLATQMASNSKDNYVTVCGQPCIYSDASDAAVAKCSVPSISTSYSNTNFKIQEPQQDLVAGKSFGTNADHAKVFDNNLLNNQGADSTADCHIGAEFREGFVGLISQVRWYMGDINDRSLFNDTTKF